MASIKILLTGATGFIGTPLVQKLRASGIKVIGVTRKIVKHQDDFFLREITPYTAWDDALKGVDVIIHTAGRVHVMNEDGKDLLEIYRDSNLRSTLNLANQAVTSGVKRFIFISSVKVLGEKTIDGVKFSPHSPYAPVDPYSISKMEAEIGLKKIAESSNLEVIIIRPPIVYGPGVKANFLRMLKLIQLGVPLPFGDLNNKRSMVFIDNLTDFVIICIFHKNADNKIFMVSDGHDISVSTLFKKLGIYLDSRPILIPIPASVLLFLTKLGVLKSSLPRLAEGLEVDVTKTMEILDWTPNFSVDEGLRKTVQSYLKSK